MEDNGVIMDTSGAEAFSPEESVYTSPIAKPMAPPKLIKKITKLIKGCVQADEKQYLRFGLKNVQISLRRKEKGIVVFSGDVTPIEMMCHLPAVCEELNIPYVYVPNKNILGAPLGKPRGPIMVMLIKNNKVSDLYDDVVERINALPPPW